MRNINTILLVMLLWSCTKGDKLGKHHSHKKQKEVEEKSNFHEKQAKEIIDENLKNKDENKSHAEQRRHEHNENLEELNKPKTDEKKTFQKRPDYNFY